MRRKSDEIAEVRAQVVTLTEFGPDTEFIVTALDDALLNAAELEDRQERADARVATVRGNTSAPAKEAPAKAPEPTTPRPGEPGYREAVIAQEMMRRAGRRG